MKEESENERSNKRKTSGQTPNVLPALCVGPSAGFSRREVQNSTKEIQHKKATALVVCL